MYFSYLNIFKKRYVYFFYLLLKKSAFKVIVYLENNEVLKKGTMAYVLHLSLASLLPTQPSTVFGTW
jgi:hypothetical protein